MRFLIRFSYDGTNFKGYQKQVGYRTIQGELEDALYKINNNKDVKVVAAGRTDKGVHAVDQVAHLDVDVNITPYKLKRALNSNLSDEIHINSAMEVPDDYFVRYHVLRKEYHYYINMGEYNPMMRNYEPMESAPHPKQLLHIDLGIPLDQYDILRRREEE